jgi:hypothetical protein
LRKLDFYEYIDDVVRKNFTQYLRRYPEDEDLRRFYYEQSNWMDFRHVFKQERLHTPVQIKKDSRRMKEIQTEDKIKRELDKTVVLPKIDKN